MTLFIDLEIGGHLRVEVQRRDVATKIQFFGPLVDDLNRNLNADSYLFYIFVAVVVHLYEARVLLFVLVVQL